MPLPGDEELRVLVEPAFRALRRAPGLEASSLRFTLPLPEPWPQPRSVVFYAYGTALPIRRQGGRTVLVAMDAALVSRPFAAVSVLRGERPVLRLLSDELALAGTQGFGPAGAKERELWQHAAEVLAEMETGPAEPSELTRQFFAQWARSNGVIASCLPEEQCAFLTHVDKPPPLTG